MRVIGLLAITLLVSACGQESGAPVATGDEPGESKPVTIYTVNYPLAWAAEQLAGEYAEVQFPAPADVDPSNWEPDLETIADYQQADRVMLNGANYARWLSRVSLANNRLVDTSRAFAEQFIAVDSGPAHSHGPEGDHSHGELAFTLWMDLSLYAQQVEAIAATLVSLLPDRADAVTKRRDELTSTLSAMDAELLDLAQQLDGMPLLYSHPVYQYFGRRYELNGRSLHWEPDQLPSERDWQELEALLRQHPAKLMLWEDHPLPEVAQRLDLLGIGTVTLRPQANRPDTGDFASNLQTDLDQLKAWH